MPRRRKDGARTTDYTSPLSEDAEALLDAARVKAAMKTAPPMIETITAAAWELLMRGLVALRCEHPGPRGWTVVPR